MRLLKTTIIAMGLGVVGCGGDGPAPDAAGEGQADMTDPRPGPNPETSPPAEPTPVVEPSLAAEDVPAPRPEPISPGQPSGSGPGPTPSLSTTYGRTIYVFSSVEDPEPSTLTVSNEVALLDCQLTIPGNSPMSEPSLPGECSDPPAGDALVVSLGYPEEPLPPRTETSRTVPLAEPPAAPQETCSGDVCTLEGVEASPAPEFPHARIHLKSQMEGGATVRIVGNGRELEVQVEFVELGPWDPGVYLDVDSPQ